MHRRARVSAGVALGLVLALILSACSAGPGLTTLSQAAFFRDAPEAQSGQKTVHIEATAGTSGRSTKVEGEARFAQDPKDIELRFTTKVGSTTSEVRVVDATLYLKAGSQTDGKFAVIDLSDPSNPIGQQLAPLLSSADPGQRIRELEKAVISVKPKDETTEIDGVTTRAYVVTADTRKALEATGQKIPDSAASQLPRTTTTTVWLDAKNLPRRTRTVISGITLTTDFTQWGQPVDVEKPSAAEITKQDPFTSAA